MGLVIPPRVIERAITNVMDGPDGCVLSRYTPNQYGYAVLYWREGGRSGPFHGTGAHRAAWTGTHGQIEGELTVHHKCFNTICVNVDHLELMTNVDNARRQKGARDVPDDGSCARGHGPEFWVPLERNANGSPSYGCIECKRASRRASGARTADRVKARNRAYYAKNREAIRSQQAERRARTRSEISA